MSNKRKLSEMNSNAMQEHLIDLGVPPAKVLRKERKAAIKKRMKLFTDWLYRGVNSNDVEVGAGAKTFVAVKNAKIARLKRKLRSAYRARASTSRKIAYYAGKTGKRLYTPRRRFYRKSYGRKRYYRKKRT